MSVSKKLVKKALAPTVNSVCKQAVGEDELTQLLYRDTLNLLRTVLVDSYGAKESVIANRLKLKEDPHCYIADGQFTFSLAAVYQLINTAQSLNYNHYRRMIFHSALNQDLLSDNLKVISAGIEAESNTPLYTLICIS